VLQRVLGIIAATDGAITMAELSERSGVDRSALAPMLDLLVRKGMLSDSTRDELGTCAGGSCRTSCSPAGCPFMIGLPRSLSPQ
jgi:hypothetical protein